MSRSRTRQSSTLLQSKNFSPRFMTIFAAVTHVSVARQTVIVLRSCAISSFSQHTAESFQETTTSIGFNAPESTRIFQGLTYHFTVASTKTDPDLHTSSMI